MKILISIMMLMVASSFCWGQARDKKPVYSMKKDAPIIAEDKSETEVLSKEELQSKPSFSMYKNHISSDTKEPLHLNSDKKKGRRASQLKSKTKPPGK